MVIPMSYNNWERKLNSYGPANEMFESMKIKLKNTHYKRIIILYELIVSISGLE